MFSSMDSNARGLPDISRPISNPTIASSFLHCSMVSWVTLTTRVAPIFFPRFSRYSLTSVMTILRAPTWRQMATAIRPMGPAPVMSTSSPTISKESAECVALPKGSKKAAISDGIEGCTCQALVAGSARYSAKQPSRFTPMPMVLVHKCLRPARQLRQTPQTICPSPDTRSPTS
ncbi:MAG: hypothetical protein BWY83_03442 [bacterium ADurb.Bin478]|nr:MAG: hypothetical protein BWY83_03442 [bacterium ADurb.Bin478]